MFILIDYLGMSKFLNLINCEIAIKRFEYQKLKFRDIFEN